MTTVAGSQVDRTVTSIADALDRWAPGQRAVFETELRAALLATADDLDLSRVDRVLMIWRGRVALLAHPLRPEEVDQLQRARAGDFAGLRERAEDGTWSVIEA